MSSKAKVNTALAAAIVFLVLSTFSAYFAFVRLRTSQSWVQHTRDVQLALHQFATKVTRAARLRAQYVDSGEAALLQRQAGAVVDVRSSLAEIEKLTSDNASQRPPLHKLEELTEQRIGLMDQSIQLKRSGKSDLNKQAVISRQMVAIADESDQLLQTMYDDEQRLLTEREKREASSFSIAAGVLSTSLFFALVLFLIHHQLLTEQVSERVRAENTQRALSVRLWTLQDEERRRFARELHDSVGQQLAAMKMALSMLESKLPGNPLLQDCLKLADESIAETRTISHLLHPPLLDEAGLNSAVQWFVEGFAKRSGIDISVNIAENMERFSETTELALFRVLQESLTNVHRHSGASRAEVSLQTQGGSVVLKVRDYGHGLPPSALHDGEGLSPGVGVAGMRERIREVGGQLEIRSGSQGTEIVANVPVRLRAKIQPLIDFTKTEEVRG